jgi:hypothetical protein
MYVPKERHRVASLSPAITSHPRRVHCFSVGRRQSYQAR